MYLILPAISFPGSLFFPPPAGVINVQLFKMQCRFISLHDQISIPPSAGILFLLKTRAFLCGLALRPQPGSIGWIRLKKQKKQNKTKQNTGNSFNFCGLYIENEPSHSISPDYICAPLIEPSPNWRPKFKIFHLGSPEVVSTENFRSIQLKLTEK